MMHLIVRIIQIVAVLGAVSSSIYYLLCLWSARAFLRRRDQGWAGFAPHPSPPVSILKPLKGADPEMYECFRSHSLQSHPEYEIIFGVSDPHDPAIASVERLKREFPARRIELVICANILGANIKVSNLAQMANAARYAYMIVNDSDIRVGPDYLQHVLSPLADQRVGMVTCLYRGTAGATLGSRLESLGISSDFCAGVLVASVVEHGIRFGLGSTMAFRRADLEKIGGFESFVDLLADDYELGRRIAGLGLRVELSGTVVETNLPAYNTREFLAHQLRWARGVRAARPGGYFGLIFTFGLAWSLLALIAAHGAPWAWALLVVAAVLRLTVALLVGRSVLQDRQLSSQLWLLPLRDLLAVGVWIASFAGHSITWRGDRFELKNGKLIRIVS